MSRICQICGKRARSGRNVSHAVNRTLRKFNPNLQKVQAIVDGKPVRMTVCSRCIKAGKVIKNVK
ncbi:50S ribosomal protein L28 [bacterium]|nr:50S ribosomal protein L28 [bacterium]